MLKRSRTSESTVWDRNWTVGSVLTIANGTFATEA